MAFFQKVKDFIFTNNVDDTYEEVVEYNYPEADDIETISSLRNAREDRRSTGDTKAITPRRPVSDNSDVLYTFTEDRSSEILISAPQNIEEVATLSTSLKEGKGAIVKLEGLEACDAQRIMDFLSGVTHTLDGRIKEITNRVFMLTPKGMEITDEHKATLAKNGLLPSGKFNPFSRSR